MFVALAASSAPRQGSSAWWQQVWNWLTQTPPGLVVLGAIIAGILGVAGGLLGALLVGWLADRTERGRRDYEHQAAVRAVLHELVGHLTYLDHARGRYPPGRPQITAYDQLLLPFNAGLPGPVANKVAFTYELLRRQDPGGVSEAVLDQLDAGMNELRTYAVEVLQTYAVEVLQLDVGVPDEEWERGG